MKKLVTILFFALLGFTLQAQNCQATFTSSIDSNYLATFSDQSTTSGNILYWNWDFGNGTTGTGQTVTFQYNTPGVYLVCLTIFTDDSCSSTTCDSLVVGNGQNPCSNFYCSYTITPYSGTGTIDGGITTNLYGGTPPFSYIWDNGATTANLTNLAIGNYCYTITDGAGCTLNDCIYVYADTAQSPCNINLTYNITDEIPAGAMNGAIDITVSGGLAPYYYYWDNGATTEDISGLAMGYYVLNIEDSDSCTYTHTFYVPGDSIANPCPMYLTGTVTDVSVIGGNDGAIDLTVYGGTPPYSYYWNTGASTEDISGLTQGVYFLQVIDGQGCSSATTFSVLEPTTPTQWDSLYSGVVDTCINFVYDSVFVYNYTMIDSNTISVTWAATGNGQIQYVTVEYAINQPGYYWVVLSINCGTKSIYTFVDGIYIDYSILLSVSEKPELSDLLMYPNPIKNDVTLSLSSKYNKHTKIQIFNSVGQVVHTQGIELNKGINDYRLNLGHLDQGIYILKVNDLTHRFVK